MTTLCDSVSMAGKKELLDPFVHQSTNFSEVCSLYTPKHFFFFDDSGDSQFFEIILALVVERLLFPTWATFGPRAKSGHWTIFLQPPMLLNNNKTIKLVNENSIFFFV